MSIVDLIVWAVVLGFIAIALASAHKLIIYYSIKKNGAFAEGEIVGFQEKSDMLMSMAGQGVQQKVYPIVEYKGADGTAVKAAYMGFVLKGNGAYEKGQKLQIKYSPDKPDRFIIIGDSNLHGNAWAFLIMGIIFAAFAAIIGIIF